jgi:hypothetical protein
MTTPNPERNPIAAMAAIFALYSIGIALFILDILTPLGIADGIGYAPLLGVSLWLSSRRSTMILAAIYAVLIVVGHLAGHGGLGNATLMNRCFALIALAAMAYVVDRAKQLRGEACARSASRSGGQHGPAGF